jgi:hypothetical protein
MARGTNLMARGTNLMARGTNLMARGTNLMLGVTYKVRLRGLRASMLCQTKSWTT